MTSTAVFFEELGRRGHEPLLQRVSATIRFEIADGAEAEQRLVTIDRGDLRVVTSDAPADAVFRSSRTEFDDLISGRTSTMASLLRGALTVEGDPELLVLAQRLFSGMPARAGQPHAGSEDGGPS